jgi:hypothetical protein
MFDGTSCACADGIFETPKMDIDKMIVAATRFIAPPLIGG